MAYTGMCAEQGMVFKVSSDANNFFLNIYFHDFSVKNYLILYAKQTNQGQKVVSPDLNRVAK